MKTRITYCEKYRAGTRKLREDLLPSKLPFHSFETTIVSMEILAADRIEVDGKEYEYQDVRVITTS